MTQKKTRKIRAVTGFRLAISTLIAGTVLTAAPGMAAAEPVRIGLALYTQLQQRWLFDAAAFQKAAEANGDEVIVQYADGDPGKQTQQVQNMLSRGIDVLVIAPADIAVGASLIDEARREGVKTIAYDIGVKDTNPDWMITRNQEMVGTLQVEAAKKFAPAGNYAVLKGDPANDLAQASDRSYAAGLNGAEGIKVVYNDFIANYDPATAQSEAEAILTRNRDDIAAFVVNNDGMAGGVVQALRGAKLNGKVFVSGLDADQANLNLIALGDQTMTVFTPIDVMAARAAEAAHLLGTGGTPESNAVAQTAKGDVPLWQLDLVAVTKDNLCDFVHKIAPQGWADADAVFAGSDVKCQ